jgi:hypothetical protein
MRARATHAIAELLKASPEWRRFFRECCEAGALRLRSQAVRFRDELRRRDPGAAGEDLALASVEDALLTVARKVLPKTPAAEWDEEWAVELCDDALARISEHYAGLSASEREAAMEFSGRREWEERMVAAGVANDPAAFRDALRGWERTTLAALETATQGAA